MSHFRSWPAWGRCLTQPCPVWPLAATAFAALAGCSSLSQAPLVYSSQSTIGVDISSTSAANPGVSLNFGYKQTDVAYVPVAVAIAASGAASGVVPITADYGQDETGGDRNNLRLALESRLQAYNMALADEQKAQQEVFSRRPLRNELKARLDAQRSQALSLAGRQRDAAAKASADAAAASAPGAAPELKAAADTAATEAQQARDAADRAAAEVRATEAALVPAQEALTKAELALADAAQKRRFAREAVDSVQSLMVTKKRDAMSVYGSFNALTDAGAASAANLSVRLGKVFSTGLAAQNLTEAEKLDTQSKCVAAALQAVAASQVAAASATEAAVLMQAAGQLCSARRAP